jgi:hypothetical protein
MLSMRALRFANGAKVRSEIACGASIGIHRKAGERCAPGPDRAIRTVTFCRPNRQLRNPERNGDTSSPKRKASPERETLGQPIAQHLLHRVAGLLDLRTNLPSRVSAADETVRNERCGSLCGEGEQGLQLMAKAGAVGKQVLELRRSRPIVSIHPARGSIAGENCSFRRCSTAAARRLRSSRRCDRPKLSISSARLYQSRGRFEPASAARRRPSACASAQRMKSCSYRLDLTGTAISHSAPDCFNA